MNSKVLHIFTQLLFVVICLFLFHASTRVIYNNIKYFGITKSGSIIEIDHSRGSRSSQSRGTFINTILIDDSQETVYGGSKKQYNIGDAIKIRYRGTEGNIIFEVNGLKVGSKYDAWDWVSPILFLFTSFMLFNAATTWFVLIKRKIKK